MFDRFVHQPMFLFCFYLYIFEPTIIINYWTFWYIPSHMLCSSVNWPSFWIVPNNESCLERVACGKPLFVCWWNDDELLISFRCLVWISAFCDEIWPIPSTIESIVCGRPLAKLNGHLGRFIRSGFFGRRRRRRQLATMINQYQRIRALRNQR